MVSTVGFLQVVDGHVYYGSAAPATLTLPPSLSICMYVVLRGTYMQIALQQSYNIRGRHAYTQDRPWTQHVVIVTIALLRSSTSSTSSRSSSSTTTTTTTASTRQHHDACTLRLCAIKAK
eukprot:284830-Pyramimonas_sp.AAC.2